MIHGPRQDVMFAQEETLEQSEAVRTAEEESVEVLKRFEGTRHCTRCILLCIDCARIRSTVFPYYTVSSHVRVSQLDVCAMVPTITKGV